MRVKLIFEGTEAVLTIEPENDQERAMLVAFCLDKPLQADASCDTEFKYGSRAVTGGLGSVRVAVRQAPPSRPTAHPRPEE